MPENNNTAENTTPQEATSYGLDRAFLQEVLEALEAQNNRRVLTLLDPLHPADIADLLSTVNAEQREKLVDILRKEFDPSILVELEGGIREEVLELLGAKESAAAITTLDTEDAVQVMEDLEEKDQQELLEAMPDKKTRQELEEGLAYPDDSAGRLLQKNLVSIPEYWTVGQTIDFLRSSKDLPDDFYQIFVIDPKHKPVGVVKVSRAIRSKREVVIRDIMDTNLKLITTSMDQEEVAYVFRQYALASAPVVNEEGRMVGSISVDDIVDVIEEEAEEDILRLGGVKETDFYASFLETSKRRFPWLFVNLLTAILASLVIGHFQGQIEKLVALAVLMPIVASMGGNAGTQTVTVAVRAIATKDLTTSNAWRIITKEILVGSLNGILFSIITAATAYIWFGDLHLSMVFGVATVVNLIMAGFAGATIPLLLLRFGADPAVASTVFLTTVTDVVGFFGFLGMATWLLG